MTTFHHLPVEEVLTRLEASRDGLDSEAAELRLRQWGPNRLPEAKGQTVLGVFLAQFKSPFIYLLLLATVISLGLGEIADAVFILAVLLLNACVGTFQEWRAEQRAQALRALIKGSVSVWRDRKLIRLPIEALVPGDITQVESGEKIGADMRLIEGQNLAVDESLLTGESLAVHKVANATIAADSPLGDRVTMLHAGTMVRTGRGTAVVAATALHTVVGQLASALDRPQPPPPLVRRMERFTRHLAIAMLAIVGIFSGLEVLRGSTATDIFLLAIALIVSAIPEGLPVAMTVALSIATHRMGLRNVVVRHLPAVEGLGACTLIATDKTGTLTLNRLAIERLWLPDRGEVAVDDPAATSLLLAGAHASEPPVSSGEGFSGDAVDLAFFSAAHARQLAMAVTPALVGRVPYEPERRYAAAFHDDGASMVAYVKGAPETVTALCEESDDRALAAAERLSAEGYRVIAIAGGRVPLPAEHALGGLHLFGFAGLIDPLRPDAIKAVIATKQAGIRVVMVTGDHPLTALAIARQLGLAQGREEVVTGAELERLQGEAFERVVGQARVFARTEPLQKLSIVESLRRQGHVVAVTGDGINDAAALKAADIGVAMGKGGTDVARDAADLILTDDNFASIVAGIEEGRIAYDNLRKVILLLISTGAAELLLMLLATVLALPPPLTAVQLLWLNLVTNGMQDVALAFEKGEPDVLYRSPRASHAPIFDRRMIEQVAVGGAAIGLLGFIGYDAALYAGMDHVAAQGLTLWLLVWCENAHCLNCRSETRSVLRMPLSHNPLLIGAVIGTQVLQFAALGIRPLSDLISLQQMTVVDGLLLAAVMIVILAVMEIYKWLRRATRFPSAPHPADTGLP